MKPTLSLGPKVSLLPKQKRLCPCGASAFGQLPVCPACWQGADIRIRQNYFVAAKKPGAIKELLELATRRKPEPK